MAIGLRYAVGDGLNDPVAVKGIHKAQARMTQTCGMSKEVVLIVL